MESFVVADDIPITLRRSARARRMTLRVARADGSVVLTLPMRASLAEGRAFAQSRADWLRKTRAAMPAASIVAPGAMFPVEGQIYRIVPSDSRIVMRQGDQLLVPQSRATSGSVAGWLKHLARERLQAACDLHAANLGRRFSALTLRDTKSRWGSCTHDGRLMFSWRLAMAPPEVLNYVAAHEVAHLAHMDHSAAFWAATARLDPNFAKHRAWLRVNGHHLQAWIFRAA